MTVNKCISKSLFCFSCLEKHIESNTIKQQIKLVKKNRKQALEIRMTPIQSDSRQDNRQTANSNMLV